MKNFNSDRELFSYVRNYDLSSVSIELESFNRLKFEQINIEDIINIIFRDRNILLIDARSEKEYDESSIPTSINFPILRNHERHNVGLVYKKYSTTAAFLLALEYASEKYNRLENFLKEYSANEKNIFVYCWRGGGRSKYLAKMITEIGYKCKTISGGFKSFRAIVNKFFNNQTENNEINKFDLIELSGMTGVGKTFIINQLKNSIPVIDLELAAHHYSSLFGYIPYLIKDFPPIKNQSAFENNIYSQILKGFQSDFYNGLFIVESESKKVGNYFIPELLYRKIENAPCILIESSLEKRIERIVKDYFGDNLEGLPYFKKVLIDKEKYFRKELSNIIYEELINHLDNSEVDKFTEKILIYYYDKKYKVKPKQPILKVSSDNLEDCVEAIISYTKKYFKSS